MHHWALSLLAGILLVQQLPTLPSIPWLALAALAIPVLVLLGPRWMPLAWSVGPILGFLLAAGQGQLMISRLTLPANCLQHPLIVTGRIASLPLARPGFLSADLIPERVEPARCRPRSGRLSLRWRLREGEPPPELIPGDRWRLRLRLHPVRNFHARGVRDREATALARGIRYRARVLEAVPLRDARPVSLDRWRDAISVRLRKRLDEETARAILPALVVGDRRGLEETHWSLLRQTGTLHLMAISGLHVGMVSALVALIAGFLWRRSRLTLHIPAPVAGAVFGLLAAGGYSALAGFSLPTQRAFLMLAAIFLGMAVGHRMTATAVLSLALLAVLASDPFAVNLPGFWLSFGAVALLMLALRGWRTRTLPTNWLRAQLVLAVGLLPLQALFFHGTAATAPVANLVAIPVIGGLVVPLALFGTLLLPFGPLADPPLQLASVLLSLLWPLLERLAEFPLGWWPLPQPTPGRLAAIALGTAWLMMPRGWPLRLLGLPLLLLAFLPPRPTPARGDLEIALLDVGEGLAVALRTRHHAMLYDTGARWAPGFDAVDQVVAPWWQAQGWPRPDLVLVSHGDNDHAGGAGSARRLLRPRRMLSGEAAPDETACRAGQSWQWDGVRFRILHPPEHWPLDGNEGSCVLQIEAGGRRLLLPGDIEDLAEFRLARETDVRSELLVLPHHGSRGSTTPVFLDAVRPRLALVSTGANNRFGFPSRPVRERLGAREIPLFDTGRCGSLRLRLTHDGRIVAEPPARERLRRWWHHPMQVTNWPFGPPSGMPGGGKSSMIHAPQANTEAEESRCWNSSRPAAG